MRPIYFLLAGLLVFCAGITNTYATTSSGVNPDASDLILSVDDEEVFWPFGPNEWAEEEEGTEEEEEEEVIPEESEEEEYAEEEDTTEEEVEDEYGAQELIPAEPKPSVSEMSDSEWESIGGIKVPYFILLDSEDAYKAEKEEQDFAYLKAIKYGGQILNGINFVYQVQSGDVYLSDNAGSIPYRIRIVDETQYAGVIRYDYEVAQTDFDYNQARDTEKRDSLRVVVVSQETGSTIASAFESARNKAFIRAVQNAAQKMHARFKKDNYQVAGVIKAWEILNEGYIQEDESFYIEMRVWLEFKI